jgi:dihydrofolate reductase
MPPPRTRVYIACSLDGFIAGPDDDLSWLPGADGAGAPAAESDPGAVAFDDFMAGVGALLMGRRTFDVLQGFGGDWPYGARPVLVATHRALDGVRPEVRAVTGNIAEIVSAAREAAGGRDVYIDGGDLIRQALDAKLIEHLIVTLVPVVLGHGHPLFAGVAQRHALELEGSYRYAGSMVQLHLRCGT